MTIQKQSIKSEQNYVTWIKIIFYMNSFIFQRKTEDVYKDFANDFKDFTHQIIVKIMIGYWPQE